MNDFAKSKPVWTSPKMQKTLGSKESLVAIKNLPLGLSDTYVYKNDLKLSEGLRKTAAFETRIIKQNRGSAGEGIWKISLLDKKYCKYFGYETLRDSDILYLNEMNDGHSEIHTVSEFLEFCKNGRTDSSGNWTSKGNGGYLGNNGSIVDQRFLPMISEGEIRILMVGQEFIRIEHFL